jgi:3-oxoacyl-[acyl-carrier-protein] synthase-3
MNGLNTGIMGSGSYLPSKILTNADLENMVETSNEWIIERTGIRERRISEKNELNSDMAVQAAKMALKNSNVNPEELDLIIVSTITPDRLTPSTSCIVQGKLKAINAAAFDLSAACSGFIYALTTAKAFIESGNFNKVLVIGTEKLSSFVDWKDRSSCILFGDGAGAVVLSKNSEHSILNTYIRADGSESNLLRIPAGGSELPIDEKQLLLRTNFLKMEGKETFKLGVKSMTEAVLEVIHQAKLSLSDIALIIPHQANLRIIQAISDRLKFPSEKVFTNIERCGNTSAASVAIAFDEVLKKQIIKKNDYIVLVAFGAGTTVASLLLRW